MKRRTKAGLLKAIDLAIEAREVSEDHWGSCALCAWFDSTRDYSAGESNDCLSNNNCPAQALAEECCDEESFTECNDWAILGLGFLRAMVESGDVKA